MLTTLSRTGIVMIVVEGLVFFWLRPVETKRLVPLLIPAFLAVSIALPHTLGSLYAAFFPKGGLVAEQNAHVAGNAIADGRLTRIGPSLREFLQTPLLGQGFGTRISQVGGVQNAVKTTALILDDQWLGALLEIGLVGTLGLLWMFVRTIRRLSRLGRADDDEIGWFACALAASLYAFCVGILTFDAFGFIQVTILTFLLLAVSCSLLKASAAPSSSSARSGP
jgi:polysaccharide biosynthesis protein PslJ